MFGVDIAMMGIASPNLATVRPRAVVSGSGETRLLDEVVSELGDELAAAFPRSSDESHGQPMLELRVIAVTD